MMLFIIPFHRGYAPLLPVLFQYSVTHRIIKCSIVGRPGFSVMGFLDEATAEEYFLHGDVIVSCMPFNTPFIRPGSEDILGHPVDCDFSDALSPVTAVDSDIEHGAVIIKIEYPDETCLLSAIFNNPESLCLFTVIEAFPERLPDFLRIRTQETP